MPNEPAPRPLILDLAALGRPPDEGDVHVYRVDLSAGPEGDAFREMAEWTLLTPEERGRAERLVRARDGRRFVRCRGALRTILGALLGRPPVLVAFRAGPGGKPVLRPDDEAGPPLQFNVSHSGELALIAVSRSRELGVDVEETRPIEQAGRIVESYFTASEVAEFLRFAEEDRAAAFIRGWTRKEAVVKAQGVGLAGLATEFETLFGPATPGEAFRPCSPLAEVKGWRLWEASPRPGYVAALAVAGG
ncbi:4'-phosphopantetheinyl transferase family protein [Paludisphaera mucosa]|uniref:4'-phosphopantetheinyl transferase superfamily protein n=1 Tax=Paludisphaera mucosa TaxID=3030827 RepID=A0ABT6FDP0_9BACT|nr:4'-phosphopantetheinyl transferase superfamily protein [Paludisphaera mucosa]MDG3005690.1 4'-phosphopantetheinyl transferase superfamily protein [Paludisphaera mucosa]